MGWPVERWWLPGHCDTNRQTQPPPTARQPQLQQAGCFNELIILFCSADPAGAARAAPAVAGAARRCIGVEPPAAVACPDARRIAVGGVAPNLVAPAAAAGNATAPAAGGGA